jgi:hypothetical protein
MKNYNKNNKKLKCNFSKGLQMDKMYENALKDKIQTMLEESCCDDVTIDPEKGVSICVGTTVKAYGDSYGTWEEWEYNPNIKKVSGCYGDYIKQHGYSSKSKPSPLSIESSYLGEDFRKIKKWLSGLDLPIKMSVNIWHD